MVRFLASGGASFATEVAMFTLVYALVDDVPLANGASLLTSAVVNYTLQARWVFTSAVTASSTIRRYMVGLVGTYLLSTPLVAALVHLGVPGPAGKVITSLALAPFAYLLGQRWIYAQR